MTNITNLNFSDFKTNYNCDASDPHQQLLNQICTYNNFANKYGHRQRINLFHKLLKWLDGENFLKNKTHALDIGCNVGYYSAMIKSFGFENVRGIDIDEKLISAARSNFSAPGLSFEVQNAENIDTGRKVDFVLCTEVIEHTQDPQKVIRNIKDILDKDGIAVITLPNSFSLPYLFIRITYTLMRKRKDGEYYDHLKYPFYKTIKLFKENNLMVIKSTGTNCFYFNYLENLPFFGPFSRLNFHLSYRWPFKYFSQFFFLVVRKT